MPPTADDKLLQALTWVQLAHSVSTRLQSALMVFTFPYPFSRFPSHTSPFLMSSLLIPSLPPYYLSLPPYYLPPSLPIPLPSLLPPSLLPPSPCITSLPPNYLPPSLPITSSPYLLYNSVPITSLPPSLLPPSLAFLASSFSCHINCNTSCIISFFN